MPARGAPSTAFPFAAAADGEFRFGEPETRVQHGATSHSDGRLEGSARFSCSAAVASRFNFPPVAGSDEARHPRVPGYRTHRNLSACRVVDFELSFVSY